MQKSVITIHLFLWDCGQGSIMLKGGMSFSKPNDPLLPSSLPFIVEYHPAHSCSSVPGYIINFSVGWKLAVFQSHTMTTVPTSGRTEHMSTHAQIPYITCAWTSIRARLSHIQIQQWDLPHVQTQDLYRVSFKGSSLLNSR